jgi:hypothetical protein
LLGHALPHVPQLFGSFCKSKQTLPPPPPPPGQSEKPGAQQGPPSHAIVWHIPLLQATVPPRHAWPHPPQWFGSVIKSAQFMPHRVAPIAQVHMPPAQVPPVPQELPHPPQWFTSVMRLKHPVGGIEQKVSDEVLQVHCPAVHVAPDPHGLLHPPQWSLLVCVSTHTPAHAVMPASHVTRMQLPLTHA